MSDTVLTATSLSAGAPAERRVFCYAMLAATVLPILAIPLFGGRSEQVPSDFDLLWLIFFFARGHVALTVLFYFDRNFRELAKSRPVRFIVAPLLIVGALPFLLMASDTLYRASVLVVLGWNVWHFHKQNLGVLSLICIANRQPPPDRYSKLLAGLACAIAIASFVPRQYLVSFQDTAFISRIASFTDVLFVALVAVIALSALACTLRWRATNLLGQLFYLTSVSVYSLVFLFPDEVIYFAMAQATAHGLQYAIMVYIMGPASGMGQTAAAAATEPNRIAQVIYACLVWAVLLVWSLFILKGGYAAALADDLLGAGSVLPWMQGFAVSALFAHFVVDGGAFKIREQGPRRWMQLRIGTLMTAR